MVSHLLAHAQKLGDVFDVDWDDNWETEMLEENPQQVLNDCGLCTVVNLMTELLRLRGDERPYPEIQESQSVLCRKRFKECILKASTVESDFYATDKSFLF